MNEPVIVPDASVLLKWSLESPSEEDRGKALAIRGLWIAGRHRIVLPCIWSYETGNVLGSKQPDLARELLEIHLGYEFWGGTRGRSVWDDTRNHEEYPSDFL